MGTVAQTLNGTSSMGEEGATRARRLQEDSVSDVSEVRGARIKVMIYDDSLALQSLLSIPKSAQASLVPCIPNRAGILKWREAMLRRTLLANSVVMGILLTAGPMPGSEPQNGAATYLPADRGSAFAGPLRELLLRNMPTPLYEASPGWGRTATVATGIEWSGKGLRAHPRVKREEKNDGIWRRVRITGEDLAHTTVLQVRNIQHPEAGRRTFEVLLAFDARVDYEQQKWKAGIRIYSGSARARLRVQLALLCELRTRLEWNGALPSAVVFRLHVVPSNLAYSNLVVEHIAGVGGDLAKLIGEAIQGGIRRWRPSLERNLLARANAAIEKAADTKELRLGLGSLLQTD
jgi:hypothetical protein